MSKKDPSWKLFIAQTLLDRLQTMRDLAPDVRLSEDIEAIHQMRVASRKLRAALEVSGGIAGKKQISRWSKAIGRVTRSLGRSRDLDVQIDFVAGYLEHLEDKRDRIGIERLLLRLQQARQRYQPKVIDAVERFEKSDAVESMSNQLHEIILKANRDGGRTSSGQPFTQARRHILKRLEELHAYRTFVDRPTMNTQLHEMRISAKHLRYTLELFAPTYADDTLAPTVRAARKLQNALGKLHDCDMWIDMLPRFYDAESVRHEKFHGHRRGLKRIETAIENLTEHQRTQRQQVYERFASYWHKIEAKGVWVELRDLLDNPPAPLTPTTADQPPIEDDTPEHPSPPPHEPIVEVKTGLRPTHPMDN